MKKLLIYWFLIFISGLHLFPIDILKKEEILLQQDKILIQRAMSFCVQKGDRFFLVDFKAKDIKLFDKNGKFVEIWGKQGYGPLEFGKPLIIDYREPYLAVMDLGKRKFMVYSDEKNPNFSLVTEFMQPGMGSDLRVMGHNLLISGSKTDNSGNPFQLYLFNYLSAKIDLLIPIEEKFGYESFRKFKSAYETQVKALLDDGFCDIYNDYVYYAWTGDIRVIRIDLRDKKKLVFGHKSSNFIKQNMTKSLVEKYAIGSTKLYQEYRKFSFLTGVFADEHIVGVLYCNYHEQKPGWQYYIQFYTPDGNFIEEEELPGAINNDDYPLKAFYYDQKDHILYFLAQTIDKDLNDIYRIIKYTFKVPGQTSVTAK